MSSTESELAVLFADISGSTRLYEKLGDTEALYAVDRCIKRMERAVEGYQGRIIKTIGDELMVAFPTAEAAFQAAMDMQQRVLDLPPASGVKLNIRVGFHFGPAIEENNDLFGDTVNTAARMAGLAKAGQIITNAQSLATVSPLLRASTRDVDRLPVKGKSEEMQIVEVLWQESEELTMKAPSIEPTQPLRSVIRLCVRHHGKAYLLDDKTSTLTFGRGGENDVVIDDRKASRSHAKIERRRDKYVLVDQSTNGTFVAFEGEAEVFLRREEIVLRNKGLVAFGHTAASGNAEMEVAQFEYL